MKTSDYVGYLQDMIQQAEIELEKAQEDEINARNARVVAENCEREARERCYDLSNEIVALKRTLAIIAERELQNG